MKLNHSTGYKDNVQNFYKLFYMKKFVTFMDFFYRCFDK